MPAKRLSKSHFVTTLAEKSGLNQKQVAQQLGKHGPGEVRTPGLLLLAVVEKSGTPQHAGIDPFTRDHTLRRAKPTRKVIRAGLLKALKDAV